jgi:hypothetical protein
MLEIFRKEFRPFDANVVHQLITEMGDALYRDCSMA